MDLIKMFFELIFDMIKFLISETFVKAFLGFFGLLDKMFDKDERKR